MLDEGRGRTQVQGKINRAAIPSDENQKWDDCLKAEGIPNRFLAGDSLLDLFFERMKNQKKRPS